MNSRQSVIIFHIRPSGLIASQKAIQNQPRANSTYKVYAITENLTFRSSGLYDKAIVGWKYVTVILLIIELTRRCPKSKQSVCYSILNGEYSIFQSYLSLVKIGTTLLSAMYQLLGVVVKIQQLLYLIFITRRKKHCITRGSRCLQALAIKKKGNIIEDSYTLFCTLNTLCYLPTTVK
ncbi:hypothetical protein EDC96DRAFT_569722 [Choanephora cucurbitarum]|nr:hypothetical protein EDC96DRAFT_569722 [Choanephora cucurbitarum]